MTHFKVYTIQIFFTEYLIVYDRSFIPFQAPFYIRRGSGCYFFKHLLESLSHPPTFILPLRVKLYFFCSGIVFFFFAWLRHLGEKSALVIHSSHIASYSGMLFAWPSQFCRATAHYRLVLMGLVSLKTHCDTGHRLRTYDFGSVKNLARYVSFFLKDVRLHVRPSSLMISAHYCQSLSANQL